MRILDDYGIHNPLTEDIRTGRIKYGEVIKKMEKKRNFREVEPRIIKFVENGDYVEGEYMSKDTSGNFGNDAYTLKTSDGLIVVFGTAVLSRKMELVKFGDYVRITYEGTKENKVSGQNDIKQFKVEVAD